MNNSRRKVFVFLIICLCLLFSMGMSGMGTQGGERAVQSPYNAEIMDITNNKIDIKTVVIDGRTTFSAYLGKGKVHIPFENISRIVIKNYSACIYLKNSEEICDLKLNKISKLSGKTSFGTYQISLKDLLWIDFKKVK